MQHKSILGNSLRQSFALIRENKPLFALLLILQIAFFVAFSLVNLAYQAKILESAKAIADYLSQQKLDEVSVTSNILQQKGILGEDHLSISRNFDEILKNFKFYLISIFILLVLFTSVAWAITYKIVHKTNFRGLIKNFFRVFAVSLLYLGLGFAFFFSLLNFSLAEIASESIKFLIKYIFFLIFSIILAYFMFISLSLLPKTELKNIARRTSSIGVKKMHYILAVYFINISLLAVSIFLLYYFIEKNLFALLLSLALMIFSFVFGRIFMVKVVEKIEKG